MAIRAITFDFWQTLYTSRPVDFNKRVRQFQDDVERAGGMTLEQTRFEAAVRHARDEWNRTWVEEYRTLDAAGWLSIVLEHLGISLKAPDRFRIETDMENRILAETPLLTEAAQSILADLSEHYRLAIISDTGITPGRVLRMILKRDELSGYFTHLTFSDEIGCSKPHPQAFLTTLEALDVEATAAVHVGDLLRTDIAGAQNVSMRGVQYIGLSHDGWPRTTDQAVKATIIPDAIIGHHTELKPLIQRWNNSG